MRILVFISVLSIMMLASFGVKASCDSTASIPTLSSVCSNEDTFQIQGAVPSGGIFFGTGIVDTSGNFLASLAGVGVSTINYVFTDSSGCSDTTSQSIEVKSIPNVSLSSIDSLCLNDANITLTQGTSTPNTGFGVYSGNGVINGTQFSPSSAGTGLSLITFTFTDTVKSCSNDTSRNVFVKSLPSLSFPSFSDLCLGDDTLALNSATPSGGAYYGVGVLSDSASFVPDTVGIFSLTYVYTDNLSSCENSISTNLRVRALPLVSFNPSSDFCINDSASQIVSGSPIGGDYWGSGITDSSGTFSPSSADTGFHKLLYRYEDAFGCKATDSLDIRVNALPIITFNALPDICSNASILSLNQATTTTLGIGNYSGLGVLNNLFYPSMVALGSNTISYTFTDTSTNCTNTNSASIEVLNIPSISAVTQDEFCENADADTVAFPNPSGGKFFGTGILSDSLRFDPDTSGVGVFSVAYLYTDSNACSNTINFNLIVNAKPNPSLASQADRCASDSSFVLSGQSPAGGVFSGQGVTGSTSFAPNTVGAGLYSLTYSYTDGNNCTDSTSASIRVNANPVLSFSSIPDFCSDAGRQDMSVYVSADSSGTGAFTGQGMLDSVLFSPNQVGVGTYNLNYSYTDLNSCRTDTSISLKVNAIPSLSLANLSDYCVNNGLDTLSSATPSGGRYFGTGIQNDSIFNPAVAGVGTHTISYTLTDGNSCSDTISTSLQVFAIPSPSFSISASICENGFPRSLTGTPSGGSFSGSGIFNSTFYPDSVSPGNYELVYSYTDNNSCSSADTQNVTVRAKPNVSISNIPNVCYEEGSLVLNQGSPAGGFYTMKGVLGAFSQDTLDLYRAGAGTFQVNYYYIALNLCVDTAKTTIKINAQPNVGLSLASSVCENVGALNLNGGSPAGGTYFGNAVSAAQFDPVLAGRGTHSISYTYTDANTCKDTATSSIQVDTATTVSLGAINTLCENDPPLLLNQGTPSGGTYSGVPGLIGGNIYPNLSGAGNFTLNYTFINGFGCTSSDTSLVKVNAKPQVSIASQWKSCAGKDSVLLTGGLPSGGRYSGTYVDTNGFFYPDSSGVGAFFLSYSVTDTNSCTNTQSQLMVVNALPFVGLSALSDKCINEQAFILTGGFPFGAGGRYRGNAVDSAGIYSPSIAGAGQDTIWYVYTDANACSDSTFQTIEVFDLPQLASQSIPDVCLGSDAFDLNFVSPANGQYSGNGVIGNQFFSSIADTGIHQINYQFTDSNSCANDTNLFVRVNGLPDSRVTPDTAVCKDVELDLSVSGGMAYRWENGSNSSDIKIRVQSSEVYSVSVTSAENCLRVHQIQVDLFDTLSVRTNVSNALCGESDGSISVNVSGGQIPYRFKWNNGNESSVLSNLSSGIYILNISDQNLCESREVIGVSDLDAPLISLDSIANNACFGDTSGYLALSTSGSATFVWSDFEEGAVRSSLSAGKYLVELTDSLGCKRFENYEIKEAAQIRIDMTQYLPNCGQANGLLVSAVSGGKPGYSYSWNTGRTSDSLSGIPSGVYTLSVTDQQGCMASQESVLSDWGAPSLQIDSIFNTNCAASLGSIYVSSNDTGAIQYSWSSGASGASITGLAEGEYIVSATAANQCRAIRTGIIQTKLVDLSQLCLVGTDSLNKYNLLNWDNSGTGVSSWRIYRASLLNLDPDQIADLAASQSTFVDSALEANRWSTEYEVKAVSTCGREASVSNVHQTVLLSSSKDRNNFVKLNWNLYAGANIDKYLIYRYRTSAGLELIDSVGAQISNYTDLNSIEEGGEYYYFVSYRGAEACNGIQLGSSNRSINYAIKGLGVAEIETADWMLYPNPARSNIKLNFFDLEPRLVHYKIINLPGAVVQENSEILSADGILELTLDGMAPGTYFLQLKPDDGVWELKKFVIN